ncbi:MAG: nitric-oxide reductase large subunit, partial [Rhodococcus sp.]|nr:nitric-oxide reductase large subunit [Rhodococcus sp. (in: high G+C Gram-positive bacteria)]
MARRSDTSGGSVRGVDLNLSKGWVQGVVLVMVFGFFVMGLLALRTYTDSMPLPDKVIGPTGEVVYTAEEITEGQQIFLRRGLQQYGSV